jgi:predicted lipoprotein with Yx(FWY)xxD motif
VTPEVIMISSSVKTPTTHALVLAILTFAAAAAAFGSAAEARAGLQAADKARAAATLTVRSTKYGRILSDGRGRALYAFTRDRRGGRSRCYGACAKAWPVYFASERLLAGRGVTQPLIGTIRRRDGRQQVTYNGRPLYYYIGDKSPGQVLCQNVDEFGGTWLVLRPSGQLVR